MRFLTLNLRHDADRWEERFPMVINLLSQQSADLIAFQEVSLKAYQAEAITSALNGARGVDYTVYIEPKKQRRPKEGIALLSRTPVVESACLDLGMGGRIAQALTIEMENQRVDVINTHLHHLPPLSEMYRLPQARRILSWVLSRQEMIAGTVLLGDFNATPYSATYRLLRQKLESAYRLAHGHEPGCTFPTPLVGIPVPPVALDYIFLTPGVFEVNAINLVGQQPHPADPRLFASDHYGICADLRLKLTSDERLTNLPTTLKTGE